MPLLLKGSDITAPNFTQLGQTTASCATKILNVRKLPISCYNKNELNSLIAHIHTTKPDKLVFEKNELGKLSLESWKLLCKGLLVSTVKTLIIDDNRLNLFSPEHWQAFEELINNNTSLSSLSLQDNNLATLNEGCILILINIARNLIHTREGACQTSKNNWSHEAFSNFISEIHASNAYPRFLAPPGPRKREEDSQSAIQNLRPLS